MKRWKTSHRGIKCGRYDIFQWRDLGLDLCESMMYDENAATKDKTAFEVIEKLKSEFAIKSSLTNRGLMLSIAKDAAVGLIEGIKLLGEESLYFLTITSKYME